MKLLYNEDIMLQEVLFDSVIVNPDLPLDFFLTLPESSVNQTLFGLPPGAPQSSEEYKSAEVFEYS